MEMTILKSMQRTDMASVMLKSLSTYLESHWRGLTPLFWNSTFSLYRKFLMIQTHAQLLVL